MKKKQKIILAHMHKRVHSSHMTTTNTIYRIVKNNRVGGFNVKNRNAKTGAWKIIRWFLTEGEALIFVATGTPEALSSILAKK